MFLVWVGAALTTDRDRRALPRRPAELGGTPGAGGFTWGIAVWLWLTVLFANLAESVAEGRGKAQAQALRTTRTATVAHRVRGYDAAADAAATTAATDDVASSELALDDVVVVSAGEHPRRRRRHLGHRHGRRVGDHRRIGPVVRESGGDRSAVTGGTRVLSDRIVVRITSQPGETFVDRMIALVEGANRQRTPNEIASASCWRACRSCS
jgi:K+-transporting ATPase ATPase B chain